MKAHLLFADADLDVDAELPGNAGALIADLGLDVLLDTMSAGDRTVHKIAAAVLLRPLRDPEAIAFRQQVMTDCLTAPNVADGLFELARNTLEGEQRIDRWFVGLHPDTLLGRSINVLSLLLDRLRALRRFAADHVDRVTSQGFRNLFARLATELDDTYLAEVEYRIRQLRMASGMLILPAWVIRTKVSISHCASCLRSVAC